MAVENKEVSVKDDQQKYEKHDELAQHLKCRAEGN